MKSELRGIPDNLCIFIVTYKVPMIKKDNGPYDNFIAN